MAALAFRSSKNLFLFDTEFFYYSKDTGLDAFLAQIALTRPDGSVALEATIDYGLSYDDMLATFLPRAPDSGIPRAVLRKFYCDDMHTTTPKMTPEQIIRRMEELNLSEAILIEHSLIYCDRNHLRRFLHAHGREDLLPRHEACISTMPLLRRHLLPGLDAYGLPALFATFFPGHHLIFQHHLASIDSLKLQMLVEKIFELCSTFKNSRQFISILLASNSSLTFEQERRSRHGKVRTRARTSSTSLGSYSHKNSRCRLRSIQSSKSL